MSAKENMNVLFEKFEKFIKSQTIIGQEITIGDVTIIPIASITLAIGAGGSNGDNKDSGDGAGIAAKATPTALLVVNGSDVKLLPIRKGSSFESLLESVPNLIEKISEKATEKKTKEEVKEEGCE